MSHTRKSVSTPPHQAAKLLQSLTSRRNSSALAVSSAAIALPISSAFYGTHDTPSDGTTVQGRDTGWQTAYDAVRMAVEITKESSDLFLPLKAVVGAMSVMIKNYDVGVPYS
jgi:hypothetical protein